ncbi:MAG TPA: hypothetical protein PKN22_03135 [Taishania sp.]|nr:hypothetical protein [Taishania sp.]
MNKFYQVENNNAEKVVFIPDGNIDHISAGIEIKFIKNIPMFIELLNKNYGILLLHYQSESKVDIQRLITRTVREYLESIK